MTASKDSMRSRRRGRNAGPRGWRADRAVLAALLAGACGCASPAPGTSSGTSGSPPPAASRTETYREPVLGCDPDGTLYVVAIESDAGRQRLFLAASRDHGESWARLPPLAAGLSGGRRRPLLVTGARDEVYVLWEDSRTDQVGIWFNASADGGRTWLPADQRVDSGGATSHPRAPALACDDRGDVYVVFLDDRDGFDTVYVNVSRDHGKTWEQGDRRIGSLNLGRRSRPRLACDLEGTVYVTWIERGGGTSRAYVNSSSDHGATWQFDAQPLGNATLVLGIEICATDYRTATAAWLAEDAGVARVEAARTEDQGRFWNPAPLAGPAPPLGLGSIPEVVTAGNQVLYAAWQGIAPDGTSRIVLDASVDGGRSARRTVITLAQAIGPAAFAPERRWVESPFTLAADRVGNVYFAWVEGTVGAPRIGFDRLASYGRVGSELRQAPESDGHDPLDAGAPQLAADDFGHVCLLWNEGSRLHVAASPFYGESGWRHTDL